MSIPIKNIVNAFKRRLAAHPHDVVGELDEWVTAVTAAPVDGFKRIGRDILKRAGPKVDWDKMPTDEAKITQLWAYREALTCLVFVATEKIINGGGDSVKIGNFPVRNFNADAEAELIILGSTTLLSDIDVNVHSKQASVWIAIAEDLWQFIGFNNSNWRVDLYGDFTKIGNYYMDARFLDKKILLRMLELAVASYLRHHKAARFDMRVLNYLVKWCIESQGLLTDIDTIITKAKAELTEAATASREVYYEKLAASELNSVMLDNIYKTMPLPKQSANSLIGDLIILLGQSNLLREENYVLTTSVIHVVRIEQAGELEKNECPAITTLMAKCSLSPYVYILSAIEQLGYLQQNLATSRRICSLPASKYFGRLVRAIREAAIGTNSIQGILSLNPNFTMLLTKADELAALKKERGDHGNPDIGCPRNYNLYQNILQLFDLPTRSASGRPVAAVGPSPV